jgi:hypothetical protein
MGPLVADLPPAEDPGIDIAGQERRSRWAPYRTQGGHRISHQETHLRRPAAAQLASLLKASAKARPTVAQEPLVARL